MHDSITGRTEIQLSDAGLGTVDIQFKKILPGDPTQKDLQTALKAEAKFLLNQALTSL